MPAWLHSRTGTSWFAHGDPGTCSQESTVSASGAQTKGLAPGVHGSHTCTQAPPEQVDPAGQSTVVQVGAPPSDAAHTCAMAVSPGRQRCAAGEHVQAPAAASHCSSTPQVSDGT